MPDFGAPVASQVNVDPNKGLTTLSNLMSLDQQKQAITSKNIAIQQQQTSLEGSQADTQAKTQAMQERARMTQMLTSQKDDHGNSILDADGNPDLAKVLPAIGRMAPFTGQEFAQNLIKTNSDKVGLQAASLGLTNSERATLKGPMQALKLDSSDENIDQARASINDLVSQNPSMKSSAGYALSLIDRIGKVPDGEHRKRLADSWSALIQPGAQVQTQSTAGSIDTGPTIQQGTVAPPAAGGGFTPTTTTQKDVSPGFFLDAQGQPHWYGTLGTGKPTKVATTTETAAVGKATNNMTDHFDQLNAAGQSLPIATALTKTIEGLAPSAFTGVEADRKQYWSGLASALNFTTTGNAQTDTNLLKKAIAQLNISSPAGTDAARTLVEAGQPNSKMDANAIKEAAGTIAGQVKMNVAERNFLQPTRYKNGGAGDIDVYQKDRQKFEANADPRIWQYEEMAKARPKDAEAFIKRQPDGRELLRKTKELVGMGFFL